MEQVPATTLPTRSLPTWLIFIIGLLIGGGVGYGVFAYFAPNAEEIAERVRLDIEAKEEVGARKISGEVTKIEESSITIEMSFPGGESFEQIIETTAETVYQALDGAVAREGIAVGDAVAVTLIGVEAVTAEEVVVLTSK